jgi:signal transduction histidine kinase/methyl-accepting chemotaxis protein
MPRLIPRTIRGQLILGTALLQCLLVAAVFWYVYRQQRTDLRVRTAERLTYQVHLLSAAVNPQLRNEHIGDVQSILDGMLSASTIRAVRVTDLYGNTLAYSDRHGGADYTALSPAERKQLRPSYIAKIFDNGDHGLVGVSEINIDSAPVALAWVYPDTSEDQVDLSSLLRSALLFALLAIAADVLFSALIARSVTRPLRGLLRGTKLLIREPERGDVFPLKTSSMNEAGELTRSFNTMVASLNEQRAGLNDTLALLDSMLANAPIGFAFFDRKLRYVRMNQFLAEMDQISISRHLGRSVEEVFPGPMGIQLSAAIEQVFSTASPVRDLELHPGLASMPDPPRTWLTSLYPVRIGGNGSAGERSGDVRTGERPPNAAREEQVRWVGAFVIDTTERKLSEEMLRRTEKLAATGRLAASIAHEINNPLGAITNLLYLLHQQPLDPESLQYAEMAQLQIARVSQITQQTLRFYRQSSRPEQTNLAELLDSVLDLHHGRLNATRINVIRRYRGAPELFAFAGEMRQLFANLVGNAVDAMPKGGNLVLSVRESRARSSPEQPEVRGLRIVVADTGSGMNEAVKKHIFDAFFTTKETTGTGLGLWISSEIIAKHKGIVRVRSRPSQHPAGDGDDAAQPESQVARLASGTVFMLFFPLESDAIRNWREFGNHDVPAHTEPARGAAKIDAQASSAPTNDRRTMAES